MFLPTRRAGIGSNSENPPLRQACQPTWRQRAADRLYGGAQYVGGGCGLEDAVEAADGPDSISVARPCASGRPDVGAAPRRRLFMRRGPVLLLVKRAESGHA
ncbi:protein of unknown function [Methylocella tundrae]|uniref:Uncharacterized protein n=1 Tax=Methylocella tundrae TaxID=227605 RepID=A0A4U8Z5N7_METTU|nr:protein of unknown function [Methylocella tundrae]